MVPPNAAESLVFFIIGSGSIYPYLSNLLNSCPALAQVSNLIRIGTYVPRSSTKTLPKQLTTNCDVKYRKFVLYVYSSRPVGWNDDMAGVFRRATRAACPVCGTRVRGRRSRSSSATSSRTPGTRSVTQQSVTLDRTVEGL